MAGNITGTISNEQTASLILMFSGVSTATVVGQGVSLNTGNQSDASTIAGLSSSLASISNDIATFTGSTNANVKWLGPVRNIANALALT